MVGYVTVHERDVVHSLSLPLRAVLRSLFLCLDTSCGQGNRTEYEGLKIEFFEKQGGRSEGSSTFSLEWVNRRPDI